MIRWLKAKALNATPTREMGIAEVLLALSTPVNKLDEMKELIDGGKYELILQERKKKRSLTANAYMWVVADAIAKATDTTKENVYRLAVKDVGVFDTLTISTGAYERFKQTWEGRGTGWVVDPLMNDGVRVELNAYYGSSTYTSSEMARLIDWLVEEAEGLELDVLPPKERSLLIEKWKPE